MQKKFTLSTGILNHRDKWTWPHLKSKSQPKAPRSSQLRRCDLYRNVLILLSDQHAARVLGGAGGPHSRTPALDALAARGTRFSCAYCNAPICVPSRVRKATGLPIHEFLAWDNVDPYCVQRRSFMHRARDTGMRTRSIGKLHFRASTDDTSFDEQIEPMHVVDGAGNFTKFIHDPAPRASVAKIEEFRSNSPPHLDPEAVDALCRCSQAERQDAAGGREAVPALSNNGFGPAPEAML